MGGSARHIHAPKRREEKREEGKGEGGREGGGEEGKERTLTEAGSP